MSSCPICLNPLTDGEIGSPESCDHSFCLNCIREWARVVNTCPIDRSVFNLIFIRNSLDGPVVLRAPVPRRRAPPTDDDVELPEEEEEEEAEGDVTTCEVCGSGDREDRLLLCDGCDAGYHLECCDPALDQVPVNEWFCPNCTPPSLIPDEGPSTSTRSALTRRRVIPRTRETERVRARIMRYLQMTDVSSEEDEEIENESDSDQEQEEDETQIDDNDVEDEVASLGDDSESDCELSIAQPKTSAIKKPKKKRAVKRKKTKKRRKRKVKRRKRVKGRGRRRVVKRRTAVKEVSVHSRLADKLGIVAPKPGHFLPALKSDSKQHSNYTSSSSTDLKIFGDSFELRMSDSASSNDSSDCEGPLSRNARWFNRPLRRLTQAEREEMAKRRVVAAKRFKQYQDHQANPRRNEIDAGIFQVIDSVAGVSSKPISPHKLGKQKPPESVDLLDSILDGQTVLHVPSKHMQIEKDGSLKVKESVKLKEQQRKDKAKLKAELSEKSEDVSKNGDEEVDDDEGGVEEGIEDECLHDDVSLGDILEHIYKSASKQQETSVKNPSPDSSSVIEKVESPIHEVDSSDEVVKDDVKEEVAESQLVSSTVQMEGDNDEQEVASDCDMDMDLEDEEAEPQPMYPTIHQSYPPPREVMESEKVDMPAPDSLEARIQAHLNQMAFGGQAQPPPPPASKRKTLLPAPPITPKKFKVNQSSDYESDNAPDRPPSAAAFNHSVERVVANSPHHFNMGGPGNPQLPLRPPQSQSNMGLAINPFLQVPDSTSTRKQCYDQDDDQFRVLGAGIREYFEKNEQECNAILKETIDDNEDFDEEVDTDDMIDDDLLNDTQEGMSADSPQLQMQKKLLEMNPVFMQNLHAAQLALQQQQQHVPNILKLQHEQQLLQQQQQEQQLRQRQEQQIRQQQQEQQAQQQMKQQQEQQQQQQLQQILLQQEHQKLLLAQGLSGLPASILQANLQAQIFQQAQAGQAQHDLAALLQAQMFGQPSVSQMAHTVMTSMFSSPKPSIVSQAGPAPMSIPKGMMPECDPNLPNELASIVAHFNQIKAPQPPPPPIQPPRTESSDKRARHLRFSEDVIEHSGEESRPSLTKRLRQATGGSSPYSPTNLSPIDDDDNEEKEFAEANQVDMEEKLSKAEQRQKRKELKLKKMLMEATSTTADEEQAGSAVEMNRKHKLLSKFNYQIRVEEEVKQALRPFYSKKKINKDEYKDIMRRAVPKITMKKGTINPAKVQSFVEAYVKIAIQARTK